MTKRNLKNSMKDGVSKVDKCFLCGRNGNGDRLDRHHIFGADNRSKSEKYGLVVLLCHSRCHIYGKYSVHQNAEVMEYIHKYGQRKAMKEQGWSKEQFAEIFHANYLD